MRTARCARPPICPQPVKLARRRPLLALPRHHLNPKAAKPAQELARPPRQSQEPQGVQEPREPRAVRPALAGRWPRWRPWTSLSWNAWTCGSWNGVPREQALTQQLERGKSGEEAHAIAIAHDRETLTASGLTLCGKRAVDGSHGILGCAPGGPGIARHGQAIGRPAGGTYTLGHGHGRLARHRRVPGEHLRGHSHPGHLHLLRVGRHAADEEVARSRYGRELLGNEPSR